jgi:hypothetical protein
MNSPVSWQLFKKNYNIYDSFSAFLKNFWLKNTLTTRAAACAKSKDSYV